MLKSITAKTRNLISLYVLIGIPVLFLVGSLMHFIYEWSGNLIVVGIFTPTNESVWEHLKLTFWPVLIWWFAGYFILNKDKEISTVKWFVSCSAAELICPLVILAFFYTYTGAIGIESLFLDIFSLFLALAIAQVLALHIYKHAKLNHYYIYPAIALLILLLAAYVVFTFAPPHIPLFKDSLTGNYGI